MASSSSSSSSQEEYEYEVFLSFRGEDTRRGFTAHLYDAFHKKNIRTFMDDEKAETGYKISPQLRKAIMGSKIWIIVFSKDFASSTWCLDEVLQILECNRNRNGEIKGNVIPIFYGIRPTIVRKQKESYATAFAQHAERFKDRIEMVQQWRDALNEVSGVTGHDSENFRYDHELIDKIVNDVLLRLPKEQLTIDHFKKNLIGIEERVKDIESFLCIDSEDDVCIIGIWGMGGIGKTTLAGTVFEMYKSFFDADFFLKNIREESKRQGKEHLRKKLFFGLLNDESILMKDTPFEMSTFIQKRLGKRKVIVVLDDMDEILSLKYFLEGHEQFGTGSRIIVTTRDVQLLRSVTDKIYEVKGLDYSKARKLFHKHAFGRQVSVAADYEALSKRAIARANGNPLALKVLGSFLCSKSKQEWKSALDKQEIDPHKEILQVLKISYDGLSKGTQTMFLDIACFITGEVYREEVENMFSCSDHYDVTIEITALIDKSLLTESPYRRGYLLMHDLLREMGQAIVCDESKIPGNRSRLWTTKDILHVLEKNKGTDAIQGILLNLCNRGIEKNVQVSPIVFSNMCHLRYLKIYGDKQDDQEFGHEYLGKRFWLFRYYNIYAPEGLLDISDELRYFHWDSCPLKYLPNFSPKNLVGLIMRGSKLEKLWNEVQHVDLEKLKNINLSYSEHLTAIPNLSGAINLETIKLQGCKSLVQIHLNLQNLRKLQILDVSRCYNLKKCGASESQEVPSSVPVGLDFSYCNEVQLKKIDASYCEHLTEIPNLSGAINLETITLRGCKSLVQVALNFQNHPKLRILDLSGCDNLEECRDSENIATNNTTFIEETSSSVPVVLNFLYCERLRSIPESIGKLKYLNRLNLSKCPNLEKFPEISSGCMECLLELSLDRTWIEELPESIENIKKLKYLSLNGCKRFKTLPQSIWKLKYLEKLIVCHCPNLQGKFPEIWDVMECLYEIDLEGTGIEELPESIENIKKLQHLSLNGCKRLKSLPQSIWKLKYLEKLIVCYCPNLQGKFPEIWDVMEYLYEIDLGGTGIEELPESIENMKKLKHLYLNGCKRLKSLPQSIWKLKYLERLIGRYCPNLQGVFPEIWDVMEYLYEIDLGGTGIEELPESIENLTGLTILNLVSCTQIKFLPKSLRKLSRLVRLNLMECSSLEELPLLPLGLTKLDISYCESLKSMQQIPSSLSELDATGCTSMKTISSCESAHIHNRQYFGPGRHMLWSFENCLDLDHNTRNHIDADLVYNRIYGRACPLVDVVYPEDEIPKWFDNASTDAGNSFNFQLPLNWFKFTDIQVPFVVCIVGVSNNFDDDNHDKRMREVSLEYKIKFKINTIDGHLHEYIGGCASTHLQAQAHNADHVFIMHNRDMCLEGRVLGQLIGPHWCFNHRGLQSSFSIRLMERVGVNLNIKKCGIHFFIQ
ncbi:disease resistance protein TAO1 [Ziziphus jujuba]|uniref:Disease resistance protein TAO1 n=2 Tax=Ziziphus jujuba TaxID=326968 RepID=A0ABM3ZY86_ZIZJJ|nr:disease resistance protein TAO1 [Ziziphus jujuba]XP_048318344.2 disease resistance protein TAO1 [Ziziphus jujuba]XP_060669449.1 disease resistance protein TAO1 [Ziziphus jujuba]XP_060669450.1 disease resistance protein TAO1 [Ziziphus jujuba]